MQLEQRKMSPEVQNLYGLEAGYKLSQELNGNINGTLLVSVLPPLLVVEFILGFLGNGLALWIFCFHLKPWKSSTVLLFNLPVADFLLSVGLPLRASYYFSGMQWKLGSALCQICLFMFALNRSGSTFFLMAIAADRYMRVVHPHHPINSLSVSKAMCGALVLWLVTISMTAHVFSLDHDDKTDCDSFLLETTSQNNRIWHKLAFLLSFLLPLLVILYCTVHIVLHLRGKQLAQHAKIKRALCLIAVVTVLFIVCFLPSNITQLLLWIKHQRAVSTLPESEVCPALEDLTTAFYITLCLTYINSMLDPLVYYFSSPVFKRVCRKVLHLPQSDSAEDAQKNIDERGSQSLSQL